MMINNKMFRVAGLLYLVIIAFGIFAQIFVLDRLVVAQDPEATANNILAHETLYRVGLMAHVLMLLCALLVLLILYHLFKGVNKHIALFMVFFDLTSIIVECCSLFYLYEPLILLKSITALSPETAEVLAYSSLLMQSTGYDLALFFFGFFCISVGYLIRRSAFVPNMFGVLMMIAGLCYIVNSSLHVLAPPIQGYLLPYILLPCLIGELTLAIWLLYRGFRPPPRTVGSP